MSKPTTLSIILYRHNTFLFKPTARSVILYRHSPFNSSKSPEDEEGKPRQTTHVFIDVSDGLGHVAPAAGVPGGQVVGAGPVHPHAG